MNEFQTYLADTARLNKIASDMGISITEAEDWLDSGYIAYDPVTNRYFATNQVVRPARVVSRAKPLTRDDLNWLTR